MTERKDELLISRVLELFARRWLWWVIGFWLLCCAIFIVTRWAQIQQFALADTDDNLRMSQVRALLHGQSWYDLRQYRLNPPIGANIHWSRLVDLPIAGLILLFRPLFGGIVAEKIAITAAPLLPLLPLLLGVALTARRLVDPRAVPLAVAAIFFAGSTTGQFVPTRMDHHGWQLALLSLAVAGLADPKRRRGGASVGIATALSLGIGLEMMIYLAIAGAAQVLFWVADREQRARLATYALTLAGGTALSFLTFASYANRAPVCDALSPAWLSDALLGGALLFLLAMAAPHDWKARLGLAAAAGLVIAGFHAWAWPACLSRLEGVSPEVERLWLSHVREARPIYRHDWQTALQTIALPLTGMVGWVVLAVRNRLDAERLCRTLGAAAPAMIALLLLFWQTRAGPAAQMLAGVGSIAIIWIAVPAAYHSRWAIVRVLGVSVAVIVGLGAAVPMVLGAIPDRTPPSKRDLAIGKANRLCNSMWGFKDVGRQPRGLVFTFVDLGPRLITVTRHDAIAGPYHRNGEQIADIMNAFRGSERQARAIVQGKYRADYLLTCPDSSTTTIFRAEAPKGFYVQLAKGKVPDWLTPVPLPKDSPFRMWRVARAGPMPATTGSSASGRR